MGLASAEASLGLFLSTWLATDSIALESAESVCTAFDQLQILRQLSSENKEQAQTNSAALNRWLLRVGSLLGSRSPPIYSLGARLGISTSRQSPAILLSQGAGWLTSALAILARCPTEKAPSDSVAPVVSLALHIFQHGSQWPEFSRENCDSKALLRLARSLISLSSEAISDLDTRAIALQALGTLLPSYSTTLRPVATQLQSLALAQLLHPNTIISNHAIGLFISLYRLSGKVDASLSWSTTIKGTIGTLDIVLETLVSPIWDESLIFSEANSDSHRLAPLDIPLQTLLSSTNDGHVERDLLPINRIPFLLGRLNRLIRTLVVMLSEPTERPVSVPVGELCRLAWRLLSIGKATVKDRPDSSWKAAWDSVGATMIMRSLGCRLIAQIATSTSSAFMPFSTPTLLMIASAVESSFTVEIESPDNSVLYMTYAKIASCCAPNPDTIKSTLEPILKAMLRDMKHICGRETYTSNCEPDATKNSKSKNKNKRYESDQAWGQTRVVDQLALLQSERGLKAFELLSSSVPHFFPSPYLTILVRYLVSLASHISFFSPVSTVSTTASTTLASLPVPAAASPGLAFATRPSLRPVILRCLINCIPIQRTSAQPAMGLNLAESMVSITSQLLVCQQNDTGDMVDLARTGLREIGLLVRPRVPPISLTQVQFRAEEDEEEEEEDNVVDGNGAQADPPVVTSAVDTLKNPLISNSRDPIRTMQTEPNRIAIFPTTTIPRASPPNSSPQIAPEPRSPALPVNNSFPLGENMTLPGYLEPPVNERAQVKRKSDELSSLTSELQPKSKQAKRIISGPDDNDSAGGDSSDESEIPQLDLEDDSESDD